MENIINQLPTGHFGDKAEKAVNTLLKGECICIYGMPGCGTRYFLQTIQNSLEKYISKSNILFFECFAYPKNSYEVIKTSVSKTLELDPSRDFFVDFAEKIKNKKIILILRHIDFLGKDQKETIELVYHLRYLSSTNLTVLSSADYPIIYQPEVYYKHGKSIFSTLLYIPPFDLEGTKRILVINKDYYGYNYPLSMAEKVYELSGGHPGLVKHIGRCVDELGLEVLDKLDILSNFPSIRIKLNELVEAVIDVPFDQLEKIGMVSGENKIFAKLLEYYLKIYEAENVDELMPDLSEREKTILSYLVKSKGKIISKDKIAFLMGVAEDDFSLWSVYKTISRLKNKIKGKYQIKTIKDKGYIFESIEDKVNPSS
ncbi:MAG: helix-turn-helix domain-containing protein [Candidatus Shapirobacteria bacterium]|jgi:hypothetical protein